MTLLKRAVHSRQEEETRPATQDEAVVLDFDVIPAKQRREKKTIVFMVLWTPIFDWPACTVLTENGLLQVRNPQPGNACTWWNVNWCVRNYLGFCAR